MAQRSMGHSSDGFRPASAHLSPDDHCESCPFKLSANSNSIGSSPTSVMVQRLDPLICSCEQQKIIDNLDLEWLSPESTEQNQQDLDQEIACFLLPANIVGGCEQRPSTAIPAEMRREAPRVTISKPHSKKSRTTSVKASPKLVLGEAPQSSSRLELPTDTQPPVSNSKHPKVLACMQKANDIAERRKLQVRARLRSEFNNEKTKLNQKERRKHTSRIEAEVSRSKRDAYELAVQEILAAVVVENEHLKDVIRKANVCAR